MEALDSMLEKENVSIFDKIEEIQKPPIIFQFVKSKVKYDDIQKKIIKSFSASLVLSSSTEFQFHFILTKRSLYKCRVQ